MEEGWNLISLPVKPLNAHPIAVLSGILGQCRSVWAYDTDTGWSMYAPGDNPGSLEEMKYTKGYWVEMDKSATLFPQGTVPEPTDIFLRGGQWNLVGCNSPNPRAIGSVTLPVPDGTCFHTYDTEKGIWLSYIMGGPDYLNTLEFFEAGKGYFIYVEQDWTIAP